MIDRNNAKDPFVAYFVYPAVGQIINIIVTETQHPKKTSQTASIKYSNRSSSETLLEKAIPESINIPFTSVDFPLPTSYTVDFRSNIRAGDNA